MDRYPSHARHLGLGMPPVGRQELREHTESAFTSGGAMRSDLVAAAVRSAARQEVVDALLTLPEGYYDDYGEVWRRLSERAGGRL